ncbi:hypothetical protein Pfo_025709 [Paulownia fortunei]|nr:hypothetical protein Pfo_025709 [Paulownia fortunei]
MSGCSCSSKYFNNLWSQHCSSHNNLLLCRNSNKLSSIRQGRSMQGIWQTSSRQISRHGSRLASMQGGIVGMALRIEIISIRFKQKHISQKVIYEDPPPYCSFCKHMGHEVARCFENGNAPKPPPKVQKSKQPALQTGKSLPI